MKKLCSACGESGVFLKKLYKILIEKDVIHIKK